MGRGIGDWEREVEWVEDERLGERGSERAEWAGA